MIVTVGCLVQWLGRYIISYQLSDHGIAIRLFGKMRILRIKYSDIDAIETMSFSESFRPSYAWRFGNRVFGEGVSIRKKRYGLFYRVIITPDNPSQFVSEARILQSSDAQKT